MNYRHIFHAGNFADVFKHLILIDLIEALQKKEKGCCFIDTHAGLGIYDLRREEAERNPEYQTGILPLLKLDQNKISSSTLKKYLSLVQKMQPAHEFRYYPGSPYILKHFLRPQDTLMLNEWHPDDCKTLKKQFSDSQIHTHHRDAYEFLPAMLPPTPRRGLVLIDPPYEDKDEFQKLFVLIKQSVEKFPNGIYAIWYPIVHREHESFCRKIQNYFSENHLKKELILTDQFTPDQNGLRGCGMLIINPPYQIDQSINRTMNVKSMFHS